MKVGDLIKIKNRSRTRYETYGNKTGIITGILRSEMNDDGPSPDIITVLINNSFEDFLPRHIKVIRENR
jgi:hypothetical protein